MKRISLTVQRWRGSPSRRYPWLSAAAIDEQIAVARTFARRKGSFITDQRGAVAFDFLFVYLFLFLILLVPLADLAVAGFRFISAWAALRSFGQYVQYNPPPDVTNIATWKSSLPTSVGGYPINNLQVRCGDTGAACTSANVGSPTKYYAYTTTVTLTPMVLSSALCGNANPCSFTLPYSERFQ